MGVVILWEQICTWLRTSLFKQAGLVFKHFFFHSISIILKMFSVKLFFISFTWSSMPNLSGAAKPSGHQLKKQTKQNKSRECTLKWMSITLYSMYAHNVQIWLAIAMTTNFQWSKLLINLRYVNILSAMNRMLFCNNNILKPKQSEAWLWK